MNTTRTEQASALGAKAFVAGMKCVPILDKELMDLVYDDDRDDIQMFEAWIKAWDMANLSTATTT